MKNKTNKKNCFYLDFRCRCPEIGKRRKTNSIAADSVRKTEHWRERPIFTRTGEFWPAIFGRRRSRLTFVSDIARRRRRHRTAPEHVCTRLRFRACCRRLIISARCTTGDGVGNNVS